MSVPNVSGNTRIGSGRVSFTKSSSTDNYTINAFIDSSYSLDESGFFYLGGNPISVFNNNLGQKAISVYNITDDTAIFASPSLSNNYYVYDGFKFSYIETINHNIWRLNVINNGTASPVHETVWQGIPLSLDIDSNIICRRISGDIDDVRQTSVGGVLLALVRVGNIWCLAYSDL